MKRASLFILVVLLLGAFTAASASAEKNDVKFCNVTDNGLIITAGANPPSYPKTKCRFAWATLKKLRAKIDRIGNPGWRFHVFVRGQRLRCLSFTQKNKDYLACGNDRRFVAYVSRKD
ncbi:MAG: hypothetical protein JJE13_00105 [Thermoleophilia bacterium]|nr:hypothetical protein [Thermoleophilia bacterium]